MPTLSFQKPFPDLAFAKPKALRLGAATYETSTWAKVLEEAARAMLDGARTRKAALAAVKRFPWMGRSGRGMARPCELDPNVWIELHQGSHGILVRTKMLLESCGYPLDRASFEYEALPREEDSRRERGERRVPPKEVSRKGHEVRNAVLKPEQQTIPGLDEISRGKKTTVKPEPYTAYPKRELFAALAEDRIPDEDFDRLLTLEGTRLLLGMTPRHDTPVFSLSPRQFFWRDPATRRGRPVFVTGQWFERDRHRLDKLLARWKDQPTDPPTTQDMKRFLDDILEHWPEGFDFSDGAVRLLEGRCGTLTPDLKRKLKKSLFHLRGKLWFAPASLAPATARDAVLTDARRLVADRGFAALSLLSSRLDVPDAKLRDDHDRENFAEFLLAPSFRIKHYPEASTEEAENLVLDNDESRDVANEILKPFCTEVRAFIESRGGCAAMNDLLAEFQSVDEGAMLGIMDHFDPDAIPEKDVDGNKSFKMLSEFYLPEDFGEALKDVVAKASAEKVPPTASFFAAALSERYMCDFAQDFALDPAYSLKWVIDAVWRKSSPDNPHFWDGDGAGARFVSEREDSGEEENGESESESKWEEKVRIISERFQGIVSLEEYADFFVETFGLQRLTAYAHVCAFFVRIDSTRAVTIKAFKEKSSWTDADGAALESALLDRMGNAPFLPLASLPESFFDSLPSVSFDGIPLRWTHELLEGITWHFAPWVPRMNYYASWNLVSTFILPPRVLDSNGYFPADFPNEVDYVLGIYCDRNRRSRSVDGAFAFLRDNAVRVRLRGSLRNHIEAFLAKREEDA